MLHQGLILTSNREYAQAMRQGLLKLSEIEPRIDVELDPVRAMQLAPQQYDLILLDLVLEAMDGLQLLQFIKHQAPASKFIIVSDSADETSRAVAYQSGADFFLERPRTPQDFALALEAIKGFFRPNRPEPPRAAASDSQLVLLADIVEMRCLSADSVLLLVSSKTQSGDIFIFRGEVYHAQYPGRGGETAFREMLRWNDGLVRVKSVKLSHVPPRTIESSYRDLLGEDKRMEAFHGPTEAGGGLFSVVAATPASGTSVLSEAPPRDDAGVVVFPEPGNAPSGGDTALPQMNSHWKVNLNGALLEGSRVADPDRCAFITAFIFRKMADVAVALELDYFDEMTLLGPHLQQVLVADNICVRHGVFDTAWTTEQLREQYVIWCREQSF